MLKAILVTLGMICVGLLAARIMWPERFGGSRGQR
jgi:hypothetical protein